jgi:hypothetical protein
MACWGEILSAQTTPEKRGFFDAGGAADIGALADTILPGATEAGVVTFIDRSLTGYDVGMQGAYKAGLAEIRGFAGLTKEERIARCQAMEKSEFFQMVRKHAVIGFFSHSKAAAKLVGYEHRMTYTPPFGYYDAEVAK